jgi:UDP:flavonoid glycosyltransferase YjiC (YdhE family)
VAAEERGIRHIRIAHGLAAEEASTLKIAAAPLQSFRPGVDLRIAESSYVTLFPEMLDGSPFSDTRRYRLPARSEVARAAPSGSPATADPLIYVTFGTVAPTMASMVPLYHAVLEAVSGLPVRVLLSVGRELDVVQLGTPPANVQIERWVDHVAVMAEASLVVCHGGAGTTLDALSAGVPMVVFPLFADQSANAHAVVDAGAGVTVEARAGAAAHRTIHSDDTAALREAILQILADPGYAEASATVRSAFSTLPLLDDVFDDIVTGRPPT